MKMKRLLLITFLILGLTASYSFAQMGQGHMGDQGMMGQGYAGSQSQQQPQGMPYGQMPYGGGYHPCQQMTGPGMMGYGGYGMMGQGHMGGGYGMMGRGHMGGYGMMGQGNMGGYGMMGQGHMGGYGMMGQGHMGGMMGYGQGYGKQGYDTESYKKYQEDYQRFMEETSDLRKQMHNKKFEYFEAIRNPDTKRETVMNLEKEMRDLQWKIYEKSPR